MSRYEILNKYENIVITKDCPLIISRYALTMDKERDAVLAQIKFQNLDSRVVKGVYIGIECTGIDNEQLEILKEYVYLDLNVGTHKFFGSDIPVYLPDKKTRSIRVKCNKIVFEQGETWTNVQGDFYNKSLITSYLDDVYGSENSFYTELKRELKDEGIIYSNLSVPYEKDGIRLCTCGEFNLSQQETCYACKKSVAWWKEKTDKEKLKRNLELFLEQQRIRETEEAERQEKLKARIIKYGKIAIIIFIVIFIIGYTWTKIINPSIQYAKGEGYYENGDYENAIAIYTELGEYKDSAEKLLLAMDLKEKEDLYNSAMTLFSDGQYEDVIDNLEKLDGYPDVTYYKAECYFQLGYYKQALSLFEEIENDSKFKSDAEKRIQESYYHLGIEALTEGELSEAKGYLQKTEYNDSKKALDLIDKIEQENWVGIYRSKDDDSEWMQIVCSVNNDLTYTYEVYRQSSIWEDYSTNVVVESDGTLILIDEFNDYNVENNGGHWIEESTHQFQEDKSVYEDTGGSRGYSGSYSTVKIVLKKQGDDLVMDTKALSSSLEYGSEEEESEYSTVYIRQ